MRPKSFSAALVGVLAAGGLSLSPLATTAEAGTAPAAAPASAFAAQEISWGRCKDPGLRSFGAQCGMLTVPLDHANPTGPTIKLAVSRIRHRGSTSRGAVFTNTGGPGGSGRYLAVLGQYVPKGVGQTYDWYGMDPRGVGASRPALSCNPKYFKWDRKPYRPTSKSILDYWIKRTDRYAAACGSSEAAELLPHMKTTDNVADFELLRQAIGEDQVTFYGFSYGTYIAQVYATQHPTSIKAMILDGVVDPTRVWYRSNLDQDYAFGKNYKKFFSWVGKRDRTYHLGRSAKAVERRLKKLERRLTKRPADGKVGPAELQDAILNAGYVNYAWPTVARAVSDLANRGRAQGVKQLYRGSNPTGKRADNGYAVYLATECTDAPWPDDWSVWAADNTEADKASPFFAWANAWYNAPCRNWPVPSAQPVQVSGEGFSGPVLLAAETHDAATPFSGALAVRRLFPTSALVEGKGGTSHSVTLSGIPCTDNAIAALLKNGALPARKAGDTADKRCPGLRPPLGRTAADRTAVKLRILPRL